MRPLRIACFTGLVLALVMACPVAAALRAVVAEFPKSPLKDYAQAEIANAEKAKKAEVRKH